MAWFGPLRGRSTSSLGFERVDHELKARLVERRKRWDVAQAFSLLSCVVAIWWPSAFLMLLTVFALMGLVAVLQEKMVVLASLPPCVARRRPRVLYRPLGASVWCFRPGGRAEVFDRLTMPEELPVTLRRLSPARPFFLLSEVASAPSARALSPLLNHGDVVRIHWNGGSGAFVVEPLDGRCSDWILHKTVGASGYGVPLRFCDAPPHYYKETELKHLFWHADFAARDDAWFWAEVARRREEPQFAPGGEWHAPGSRVELSRFPHDYVYFADLLDAAATSGSWVTKEQFLALEHAYGWEFWRRRRAAQRAHSARLCELVCVLLLAKATPPLLKPLCRLIGRMVCE